MTGRSTTGKTTVWLVQARAGSAHKDHRGGDHLGYVRWKANWRKYSFYPEPNCVFEEVCLADVSQFITERTTEQRWVTAKHRKSI